MGLFDYFKPKKKSNFSYSGGEGSTIETAIVVNSPSSIIGVTAEYSYIDDKHGSGKDNWSLVSQGSLEKNDRNYDSMKIKLKNGETKTYYFDITQFYGKF